MDDQPAPDGALDRAIDALLTPPAFGPPAVERDAALGPVLDALTGHHLAACPEYAALVAAAFPGWGPTGAVADLPFVPIGLFKRRDLRSVPAHEVFKILTSSGTTGAEVSRVSLDRATARRQSRALASVLQHVLGPARRPMLVIDAEAVVRDRHQLSARAAGVVGLMSFGRHHTFALDDDMRPRPEVVASFLAEHAGQELLVFGFTFMVWQHLVQELDGHGLDLSGATVVHSGGWKGLEAEQVTNEELTRRLRERFGVERVCNFYGMAEQVGSVFVEGGDGLLHPARFADVVVRDPDTWEEQPVGRPGVLQVVSAVPTSYPGHSVLTEDLGVVETVDDPGVEHGGKAFRVLGRVPRAELRGCSDTYASTFGG
jgi:acyl-CoA synthetase (AMP-forming)/AMP-acid ligase II